jgi:hypothetical protein
MKKTNGDIIFEGNYKNDKRNGFGKFQIVNHYFEGEYKDDLYEG